MAYEPLHDIKEHIDNIYREIPCHMNDAKNDIRRLPFSVFEGKEI